MAEPETRVHLCGRLVVRWRGVDVEPAVRSRQSRLLFGFLVLHRHRPVRRDELVAAVWSGEDAPAGAEGLLPPLLSRLRKALGPDSVVGRGELVLQLPAGAVVDTESLTALVDLARRTTGAEALTAAREALAIADGGLLPGLEAPWIDERRAEVADLRVEALELAARAGVDVGGPELAAAAADARAAVEAAPFRESARAALMRVLRAQGNTAEALRAFDDVRVLLREELGTAPGPELLALHAELVGDAGPPAPPPPAAPAPAPPAAVAPPAPALVERDRELGAIDRLQAGLALGEGRVGLIEGPAGLGKTRLLVEARRRAMLSGATVHTARASALERDFPFGVVRQLLEGELDDPARRERLLAGAAAPAAAVFAAADTQPSDGGDTSFAVLHGLYWAIVHLAAERPVVLAIDDLHWCDRPSLRLLAYLIRRLDGVPVLVLATLRSGDAATDPALLDEVLQDPATVSVRPGPLSRAAVRVVVRGRLGAHATEAFCAACAETTGGNPLLLTQLLAALEDEGVTPDDDHVPRVREIGPRAVARTIELRLARLPGGAAAVAHAVAVLGEGAELPAVAALAGVGVDEAARAAAVLARAEVLRPDRLGFVHPLIHDAVYSGIAVGERDLQHAHAARILAAAGAGPEQVAVHLAKAPPAGDPEAAAILTQAGQAAARRGAPDVAVTLLRRALAEPPPPADRSALLLELGRTEQLIDGASAVEHLAAAYEQVEEPAARASASLSLAAAMFFAAPPPDTLRFIRRARSATPPELVDVARTLEAYETMTVIRGGVGDIDLEELLARYDEHGVPHGEGVGARMLESIVGWGWALNGRSAEPCVDLALRSLADGTLARVDDGFVIAGSGGTLTLADRAEAVEAWNAIRDEAYRRGSLLLMSAVQIFGGYDRLVRGELDAAERLLREGLRSSELFGSNPAISIFPTMMLVRALLARGRTDEARAILAAPLRTGERSQGHLGWLHGEVELALVDGRAHDAVGAAERFAAIAGERANPMWSPVHDLLARAYAAAGRTDEARAVAAAGVDRARAWGAPATLGRALRLAAELDGDRDGLARAVAVLEHSQGRLERARALYALGVADGDADLLGEALRLAEACGAEPLARACVEAGAPAQEGGAALTDLERRVSDLATAGRSTPEIAEVLDLTPAEADGFLAAAQAKAGAAVTR